VNELRIPPERAGERLDVVLADAVGSRSRAGRLIEEGRVTVDGRPRPKRHRAAAGEVVVWEEEAASAPGPATGDASFTVAYEDEHLLVVDKPAGVVVHPARGHRSGTLAQALAGRAAGGEEGRAGIVHRLDRDTSGLLVVARSDEAHRRLKDLLGRRELTREYLALVAGRPPARSGTIDAPIGRDRRVRTRISTDTDEPRAARTHFEIAEALPDATLLRVRLETGRTHQIRVHLLAIGHPVVGDPEYGPAEAGGLGLGRQFLHAARLAFAHPMTGEPVDVRSPLPGDLEAALERARQERRGDPSEAAPLPAPARADPRR
jgi:23S rRNA pseudouridine1911/1915/1917 synthase